MVGRACKSSVASFDSCAQAVVQRLELAFSGQPFQRPRGIRDAVGRGRAGRSLERVRGASDLFDVARRQRRADRVDHRRALVDEQSHDVGGELLVAIEPAAADRHGRSRSVFGTIRTRRSSAWFKPSSTSAKSAFGSIGLPRYPSMPAARQRSLIARHDVRGHRHDPQVPPDCASRARIAAVASSPPITGICRSMSTRSNGLARDGVDRFPPVRRRPSRDGRDGSTVRRRRAGSRRCPRRAGSCAAVPRGGCCGAVRRRQQPPRRRAPRIDRVANRVEQIRRTRSAWSGRRRCPASRQRSTSSCRPDEDSIMIVGRLVDRSVRRSAGPDRSRPCWA